MPMEGIMLALALVLTASIAAAGDIPIEVDGKTLNVKVTPLHREITVKDKGVGNQETALGCSLLHFERLSKGDIKGAAALSTDPKATAEKNSKFQDRMGAEGFREMSDAYFTSRNIIVAELSLGDASMLVLKTPDYTAGQMYVRKGGKWLMEADLGTEACKAFGKILNKIQDGEIKL